MVEFLAEPRGFDSALRDAARKFEKKTATKVIVDAYLVALARAGELHLVTLDKALHQMAKRGGSLSPH